MSAQYAEIYTAARLGAARTPAVAVLAAALLIAGCGASGPVRQGPERADASASPAEAMHASVVPDDALAAHESIVAAMRGGDYIEAELELERLIRAHPGLPAPHVNIAILHRRIGRDDEAAAALARALEIDPGHPEANNQLGIVLRERGEFVAAEAAYRRALERRPDYSLALYNLGVLLDLYLQRPAEALEHYERYQDAASEPDEAVARWIIDLRRRVPADGGAARVAQGEQP